MKSSTLISWLLGLSFLFILPIIALSGLEQSPSGDFCAGRSTALAHQLSGEPMPPDSVVAQVLGPDSAMYISWQAPPDSGLILEGYDVYRLSDFDPEGDPAGGVQTWLISNNWPACSDPSWPQLTAGWYAYGIKAVYTNGMASEMAVSNIVMHDMYCNLTVTVSLWNGEQAENAQVAAYGSDYPYRQYFGKDSVSVMFDSVMRGHYNIAAYYTGCDTGFLDNVMVGQDHLAEITLSKRKRPAYDLCVDSVSLDATWSKPGLVALYEDFEGELFPPAGWQLQSADEYDGWFRTLDGSSDGFFIPPGDGYYATDNSDMNGTDPHSGCCDYLITPPLDLTESTDYQMDFDSYYTGAFGQLAFIEFSIDRGETWEVMSQLTPSSHWENRSLYLGAFGGVSAYNPMWIAFHGDDAGAWASGWAVDNVKIYVPSSTVEFTDFNVFLDDSLKSITPENSYNFAPLNYGQHYVASVSINYPYGTSKKDYYGFTSRYLPPPCILSGTANESDVTLQWEPPIEGTFRNAPDSTLLPENILGYKIYRDNILVDYKAHIGGYEPQFCTDSNLAPGHYLYNVSGVYDLTIYGFPGDTGESMRSGTIAVTVDYCKDLPFYEFWDSGGFSENGWSLEGPGWLIDAENGGPAPCAVFNSDTTMENYSSSLESYPFCGDSLSEGNMWLDYNISLLSIQSTGMEKLEVDVWNWASQGWTILKEYSNITGNIAWTYEHLNINRHSFNKIFRIRFLAIGANSGDIGKWCLDNISVYRECSWPTDLVSEAVPEEAAIILNWTAPAALGIDQWIHWNVDGTIMSIGTGGAAEFDVAARWMPYQLANLEGASVKEIAFYPMEMNCTYRLRVWTGAGPENLVVDQPVDDPVIGEWNIIELNDPWLINTSYELWVGYYINTEVGYPAGCDNGPAVDGFGNMMNFGGWQTLLQIDPNLNYNWNIQAHVMTIDGMMVTLSGNREADSKETGPRDVIGYNIYRRQGSGDYSQIGFTTETTYTDSGLENELYCYMVSAVWEGEFDQCESQWAGEVCEIMNVGTPDETLDALSFNLYPNPADDKVYITAIGDLEHLTIYNANGQLVMHEYITGKQYIIRTSSLNPGLYLVYVTTDQGVIARKLTIQ